MPTPNSDNVVLCSSVFCSVCLHVCCKSCVFTGIGDDHVNESRSIASDPTFFYNVANVETVNGITQSIMDNTCLSCGK